MAFAAPAALGLAATSLTVAAVDRVSKRLARPGVANEGDPTADVAERGAGSGKGKESPRPVMYVITMVLVLPSAILGYLSYVEGTACAGKRDDCKRECFESYENADRQFQSQMKGEMECYVNCDSELVRCSAVSTNLTFGAIFLAAGVLVAFCINVVIPHIIGYDESDDKRVFDEEQQRKKEKNRRRWFWQDKYQPPDVVEVAPWCLVKLAAPKTRMQPQILVGCQVVESKERRHGLRPLRPLPYHHCWRSIVSAETHRKAHE
eukprot:s920_g13.t2